MSTTDVDFRSFFGAGLPWLLWMMQRHLLPHSEVSGAISSSAVDAVTSALSDVCSTVSVTFSSPETFHPKDQKSLFSLLLSISFFCAFAFSFPHSFSSFTLLFFLARLVLFCTNFSSKTVSSSSTGVPILNNLIETGISLVALSEIMDLICGSVFLQY